MVQLEDVLGVVDQVNVPGTTEQYPNWRRKLPSSWARWPGVERFPACVPRSLRSVHPGAAYRPPVNSAAASWASYRLGTPAAASAPLPHCCRI